jgi:hypothetical protein
MRLGHILHLTGMNRDTYNSLSRRGHLAFMAKRVDGAARFTEAHALALLAFRELRLISLEPHTASNAVGASWPDIVGMVGLSSRTPGSRYCGIRRNADGTFETLGWPDNPDGKNDPVSQAAVDMSQLYKALRAAMTELVEPTDQGDEAGDVTHGS